MLGVEVTAQVNAALERPGAGDAGERTQSCVLATVSDEIR